MSLYGDNNHIKAGLIFTPQGPAATCAAKTHERELTAAAKTAIVDKHNEVRRKVAKGEETNGNQPAASNMRMLVRMTKCMLAITVITI